MAKRKRPRICPASARTESEIVRRLASSPCLRREPAPGRGERESARVPLGKDDIQILFESGQAAAHSAPGHA
ncbi:hypothetical protein [Nannocystis pusilla]|uniref:hypothetical protein n=1 Tax=Nannocystis pusilla TaxID=889268 RepID=UPI003B7EEA02